MKALQRLAQDTLAPFAALVVPTVPTIFTIEEMLAKPIERNGIMGTYTYFVNPLDLCAISVPGVPLNCGLSSALCFVGLPAQDGAIAGLAAWFEKAVSHHG
jgi:allophanate hydrolase